MGFCDSVHPKQQQKISEYLPFGLSEGASVENIISGLMFLTSVLFETLPFCASCFARARQFQSWWVRACGLSVRRFVAVWRSDRRGGSLMVGRRRERAVLLKHGDPEVKIITQI